MTDTKRDPTQMKTLPIDDLTSAWICGLLTGVVATYAYVDGERPRVDIIIEDPSLIQ